MRPATLAELAERYDITTTTLTADHGHDWSSFQRIYDSARDALRTAVDIERVVTEALQDNVADGCDWVEIQVDPTSYAERLGGMEPVVEAVLAGVEGYDAGVIVASSWARSGDHALRLAKLAGRYAGQGVVGFGLSNDERLGRVADFAAAFRHALDAGLTTAPHSGFYEPAWHVRECVEILGAQRIGHGITAAADPATLELLARRNVALEVCPTSYPPFRVAELGTLPIRTLLEAGVPVALGSDDPLLFGADVTAQYRILRDRLGFADSELAQLAGQSAAASTAPPTLKTRLHKDIETWFAA